MSIKWRMLFFLVFSGIATLNYWMAADPPSTDIFVLWLTVSLLVFGVLYHQHRNEKARRDIK